jgi:hypothetical protein
LNEPDTQYNLVFSGHLLPDTNPERARRTLAAFFNHSDPLEVAVYFSGRPMPLRRNLSRQEALSLYRELRGLGLICEIIPVHKDPPRATIPTQDPAQPAAPRSAKGGQAPLRAAQPTASTPAVSSRQSTTIKAAPASRPAATKALHFETAGAAMPPGRRKPDPQPPGGTAAQKKPAPRPRNGSAPNLFALRPGLTTRPPQALRESAQLRAFVAGAIALALCVLILAVLIRFPAAPPGGEPRGPLAAASLEDNRLLILLPTALLVHARSGLADERISAADLGLTELAPPLFSAADGSVFLNGVDATGSTGLKRCVIDERSCTSFPVAPENQRVLAMSGSYLGDSYFFLTDGDLLLRSTASGEVRAQTPLRLPWGVARLLSRDGLLLMAASDGPLLGVFRPDESSFGQQLDALLLMPDAAIPANQNRIRDIAIVEDQRWAILDGDDAAPGLYVFDREWGNGRRIELPDGFESPYLLPWRDRVLVADASSMTMARFTAVGAAEADFTSTMLADERAAWLRVAKMRDLLRQFGIGLPLLVAALCAGLTALNTASYRALIDWPVKRTALLDPLPAGVRWLPQARRRDEQIRQLGLLLVAVPLLPMPLMALGDESRKALLMLPAVLAALYAWTALKRGSGGYLGTVKGRFIAVDSDGMYFYGERSLLRGRKRWLLAPTVSVPVSAPMLENIDAQGLTSSGGPLAPESTSTRTQLLGMLWQMRHPWLIALLITLCGWLLTGIGLLLLAD